MEGQQQQQQQQISRITTTFIVGEGSIFYYTNKFYKYYSGQIFNSKLYKGHEQIYHRRKITSDNENVHFTSRYKNKLKQHEKIGSSQL